MALDLTEIVKQYEYLRDLAATDPQASAQGAAVSYANDMALCINEIIRLSALITSGHDLLVDLEAELTGELDTINRRAAVNEWLEGVRTG